MVRRTQKTAGAASVPEPETVVPLPVEESTRTISVTLPAQLLDHVEEILAGRGIDIDTFVRMGLRNVTRKVPFYGLETPLGFGKYRGETLEAVIRCDPTYVIWALQTLERFEIAEEAIALLDEVVTADR